MQPNEELDALASEHRRWLSSFNPQYLLNWEKLYAANYEAAMTEAAVRRMLHRQRVTVEPNEDLVGASRRPDFRCLIDGHLFYVEVACVSVASAEKKTGINDRSERLSPFNRMGMTEAIFNKCSSKAPQCGNVDAPVLVVVGTFHGTVAMVGFKKVLVNTVLTGKTRMTWDIDIQTGEPVGDTEQTTELQFAAFLRPDKTQDLGFARSSISGVLLCAVGLRSLRTIGVLHPNPARPFDPVLLPGIEFGQLEVDRVSQQLHVSWSNASDD